MTIEERKYFGEITETEYRYGHYNLTVRWYRDTDRAEIFMRDIAARLPLQWTKCMTKSQARGAITLFENIGYFDML